MSAALRVPSLLPAVEALREIETAVDGDSIPADRVGQLRDQALRLWSDVEIAVKFAEELKARRGPALARFISLSGPIVLGDGRVLRRKRKARKSVCHRPDALLREVATRLAQMDEEGHRVALAMLCSSSGSGPFLKTGVEEFGLDPADYWQLAQPSDDSGRPLMDVEIFNPAHAKRGKR